MRAKTGLTIDPLFSATKIRWLLDAIPNGHARAHSGELCAGTVDSWVLWNLTGGAVHACDATNASRTQLYGLETDDWDDELLEVFGDSSPRPARYSAVERRLRSRRDGVRSLPDGLSIASLIGDSHAALFGQAAFEPGMVKATYGTGSSLMTMTPEPRRSAHGLSSTVAWALPERTSYALEGNITMTGGAIDWFGQFLGGANTAATVADLAATTEDTGGVYVVPAFAGLGAPHWDDRARGLICGLTRGSTAAHVARATVESIAYQVRDVFDAMRSDTSQHRSSLLADGGASRNDLLMQFQADMLGCPVVRNAVRRPVGPGRRMARGTGHRRSGRRLDALARLPRTVDRFEPSRVDESGRTGRAPMPAGPTPFNGPAPTFRAGAG